MSKPIRTTTQAFEARMHARFKLIERARRDLEAAMLASYLGSSEGYEVLQSEIARLERRVRYHIDIANADIREREINIRGGWV